MEDMKDELELPLEENGGESLEDQNTMESIDHEADQKWRSTYLKERLAQDVPSDTETAHSHRKLPDDLKQTLLNKYEFDAEENSDLRSTVLTEESAKNFFNEEIENLKILVHVLNEKLESTSQDFSDQVDEIMRARAQLEQMEDLKKENSSIIDENNLLQDKIDELISSVEKAYDQIDKLTEEMHLKDQDIAKLEGEIPNIKLLEDYKQLVTDLEQEIESLKVKMIQQKKQAGKFYQDLLTKFENQKKEAGQFTVDYFVLGRFFRQLTTESLSHFRVRLKNQDKKELGTLKYSKVKKVLEDLEVSPQDMPNLLRLAGFYEEDPSDLIYIGNFLPNP